MTITRPHISATNASCVTMMIVLPCAFSSLKIPMIMDNDREALQLALCCCPDAEDQDNMKMIRIPNTAHIDVIEISEGMLPLAKANPNIEILSEPYELAFDEEDNYTGFRPV